MNEFMTPSRMNILILSGSPRKDGNTELLAEASMYLVRHSSFYRMVLLSWP